MFYGRPAHRHHSVNVNVNLRLFVTRTATVVDSELRTPNSGLWTPIQKQNRDSGHDEVRAWRWREQRSSNRWPLLTFQRLTTGRLTRTHIFAPATTTAKSSVPHAACGPRSGSHSWPMPLQVLPS